MSVNKWVTPEIDNFIIDNFMKMSRKELLNKLFEQFPVDFKYGNITKLADRIAVLKKKGKIKESRNDLFRYSKEQEEWLKQKTINYNFEYEDLTKEFNEKFKENKNINCIQYFCRDKLGIYFKKNKLEYSKQQDEWLIENYEKFTINVLSNKFNEVFNSNKSWSAIYNHCLRDLGLKNESREKIAFKKGFREDCKKSLGTESKRDGFCIVKVDNKPFNNKDNWKYKHRLIWEQNYGKIPEGHKILFLDGNVKNFELSNLVCVNISEQVAIKHIKDCSSSLKKCKIASMRLNRILEGLNNE